MNLKKYSKSIGYNSRGERTTVVVNGTLAAQTSHDYGTEYFTTDLFGTVTNVTDSFGIKKASYSYDAFCSLVQGEFISTTDFGYLGKQNDLTASLYNYGYRDYKPEAARFTTVDPIRDGYNWFAYCNGDSVNFIDFWGLELTLTVNKNSQMMTVELDTPEYKKRIDIPVTTHVVSEYNNKITDKNSNVDKTRGQDTKDKKTNPTQFPNGTANITSGTSVPEKYKGIYGDGWLTTDANQSLPATDGSGNVIDTGYFIHYTSYTNTNGCIGVKNLEDMEQIMQLYELNKTLGDGKAKILANGGKKNK